jgi:hypothetical protein
MASGDVTISTDAKPANSEPVFIIKRGDVYYLSMAVWEYDPAAAVGQRQTEGVSGVEALFNAGDKIEAVEVASRGSVDFNEATDPGRNG